jgi:hypothetical protein
MPVRSKQTLPWGRLLFISRKVFLVVAGGNSAAQRHFEDTIPYDGRHYLAPVCLNEVIRFLGYEKVRDIDECLKQSRDFDAAVLFTAGEPVSRASITIRVRALWSALADWQHKDRRFARLSKLYVGRRRDVIETGTDFHVRRRGEDVRFDDTPIRVAANILRDRRSDVLAPTELASIHRAYRYRVMMEPSYRAGMWAVLEAETNAYPSGSGQKWAWIL